MNSSTKKVIIYIAVFFVVLILIGMIFFRKDNNIEENNLELNNQPIIKDIKDEIITEKQKAKSFAENFTATYHSYTWGKFSNIESQYYYMTDKIKREEESRVEKMRAEIENQSQRYFTARAKIVSSDFIAYEETRAVLEMNLNINNYAGAITQRDTLVWVDEKGDYYGGDSDDLIISSVNKKIKIELLKFDDEWKVDEIMEIEK